MIDARELKIGNLIYSKVGKIIGQNEPIKVEINHLKHIFEGNEYGYEFIPLSEEWLLKANIKKLVAPNGLFYSQYSSLRLYWPCGDKLASLNFKPDSSEWYPFIIDQIRYIHTLQNIWSVLTNSELTFKI